MEHLSLLAGGQHSRAEWEEIAAAVLRKSGRLTADDPDGAVWAELTRTTLDGIDVTPLGTADLLDDLATAGRPTRAGDWDIRPLFADPDAAATAHALVTDLENGATSVWLQLGEAGVAVDDLSTVLKDVLLDAAPVVLDAPGAAVAAARAFAAHAAGTTLAEGTNLGADPIGDAARRGLVPESLGAVAEVAGIAVDIGSLAVVVDGTAVHDLGASDAQELGYSVAVGAAYLRTLVAAGHDVEKAAGLIEFRYAATDEQFPTIAKLRAARRLWARVLELSGVSEAHRAQRQHAVTSRPMMSKYDPWVNMLRTTIASFAAGVGGADSVSVLPFDARLGLPDAFSRRIARNTSSLLISEAHVARVADPGGGSYAIERLTDDLAAAGWAELGRLDGAGGVVAALADGSLQSRIDAVVTRRDDEIAHRTRPITGLTEFPHLGETLPERKPHPAGAIAVRPYGQAFEALRDQPAAGSVFLATMGTVAAHTARATFATNLFAAGGIAVVNPGRNDDLAAVLAAYAGPDGGQPVVCVTGADKAYAGWGAELVAALREAGAKWVILAGRPGERTIADGAVDDWAAVGVNALELLDRTRSQLEESK